MGATPAFADFSASGLIKRIKDIEYNVRLLRERLNNVLANTGLSVMDVGQIAQTGSIAIPAGGTLQVDGGDVVMLDTAPSAAVLLRIGTQDYSDRGMTIRRNDNSVALVVKDVFGTGVQSMLLYDRAGNTIAGDSILSGSGFDAPHIPIPFMPADYTSSTNAQTTSSTSFVALHEHRGFRQNPAMRPQFMVKCSDPTTAAQIQMYDAVGAAYLGGYLGSPAVLTITVPAGTTTFTLFEFASAVNLPGVMGDPTTLQIHAKVTAGTGTVTVAPVRTIGQGF